MSAGAAAESAPTPAPSAPGAHPVARAPSDRATFVCPIFADAGPQFAALWPKCTVDMSVGTLAARCSDGHSCMRPSRRTIDVGRGIERTEFIYDAQGKLIEERDEDGTIDRYAYDAVGALTGGSEDAYPWAFVRDARGVIERQEWGLSETGLRRYFTVDEEGSLVRSFGGFHDTAYLYDERGRVAEMRDDRKSFVASYDEEDRLVRWLDGSAVTTLDYDVNGVLVRTATRPLSLGEPFETTFQYDSARRVTEVRVTGTVHGAVTTFAYAP